MSRSIKAKLITAGTWVIISGIALLVVLFAYANILNRTGG